MSQPKHSFASERHHAHWLYTTLILCLATGLSFLALYHAERWHPDEAFYMTIARNAAVNGDWWLVSEPLDKPPLTFYANALALMFFAVESDAQGVLQLDIYKGEQAGRLTSLWCSVLLVAVGMRLAWGMYRDRRVAWITGIVLALSPLRIVFGPVAFTDMPMLLLATIALCIAVERRPALAGLFFGLSLIAKPQSIFYAPLLLVLLVVARKDTQRTFRPIVQLFSRFAPPLMICMVLIAVWDMGRVAQDAMSFYELGQARYTPTTLTPLAAYPARLATLWETLQYLFADAWLTGLLSLWAIVSALRSRVWQDWLLLAWVAAFLGAHLLLTLNLFDRNLLPLLPIAALLFARSLSTLPRLASWRIVIALLGVAILVHSSGQAARGVYDIGGDDGRHTGIDDLAAYLNDLPVAAVIYDRWLDWQLDYYMGQWSNKRRVYYPTPEVLVAGAEALGEQGTRYFVAPRWEVHSEWLLALQDAGYDPEPVYDSETFAVYALSPPLGSSSERSG